MAVSCFRPSKSASSLRQKVVSWDCTCFPVVAALAFSMRPLPTKAPAVLRGTAKAVPKAAAAFTPISQRLSPLFLGRITSFAEHCETVRRASSTLCTQGLLSSNYERSDRTADSSHLPHRGRTLCVLVAGSLLPRRT